MNTAKYECFELLERLVENQKVYEEQYTKITNPNDRAHILQALNMLSEQIHECRAKMYGFMKNEY